MLTTTSPNSILLASLDATQDFLARYGYEAVKCTASAVQELKQSIRSFRLLLLDDVLPHHMVGDPLRLCVQFMDAENVDIDENMCKGEIL